MDEIVAAQGEIDVEKILELEKTFKFNEEEQAVNSLPQYQQELLRSAAKTESETTQSYEKIINFTFPYFFDAGTLRKDVQITIENEIYKAGPIHILNRSGLLARLEEHEEDLSQTNIYLFDLRNFRAADKVTPQRNDEIYNAADVMINQVCSKLQEKCAVINEYLGQDSGEVIVGRYGGDEGVIVFQGVENEEVRTSLLNYIYSAESNGIESLEGFFFDGEKVVKNNIELKTQENGTKFSEITIPQDPELRKVFVEYMHQGVLLNEGELLKARDSLNSPDTKELHEDETFSQRMARLEKTIKKYPELGDYFNNLEKISGNDEEKIRQHLQYFEEFINRHYYDRLLGEHVISMATYYKQIEQTPFSKLYVIDTKEIKELNDNYSIAVGDMAIYRTWAQISKILESDPEIYSHIKIFRRGGMILIAETPDYPIKPEISEALNSLHTSKITDGQKEIEVGIAVHSKELDLKPTKPRDSALKEFMSGFLNENDQNWYRKTVEQNLSNLEVFDPFKPQDSLLWKHLYSNNRKRERVEKTLSEVEKLVQKEIDEDTVGVKEEENEESRFTKLVRIRNYLHEALSGIPIFERY